MKKQWMTAATTTRKTRTASTIESLSGHLPAPFTIDSLTSVVQYKPASSVARIIAVMLPEEAGTPNKVELRSLHFVHEFTVMDSRLYRKSFFN